jgi:hypothetical protein
MFYMTIPFVKLHHSCLLPPLVLQPLVQLQLQWSTMTKQNHKIRIQTLSFVPEQNRNLSKPNPEKTETYRNQTLNKTETLYKPNPE